MKMPGYYSKKPVVIQARQYDGSLQSANEIMTWTSGCPTRASMEEGILKIRTLESGEGWHIVSPGDWVIRGIKGEHYPCKPDIFESTYQEERGYPYDRPEHAAPQADAAEGQPAKTNGALNRVYRELSAFVNNDDSFSLEARMRIKETLDYVDSRLTTPAEPAREAVASEVMRAVMALRQDVRPYMRHMEDCELVRFRKGYYSPSETKCPPCSCGLEKVLWDLPAENETGKTK